jgi:hypothetical protein
MGSVNFSFSIFVFVFSLLHLLAQESTLLLNKQCVFKIIDLGVYSHYDCGFKSQKRIQTIRRS